MNDPVNRRRRELMFGLVTLPVAGLAALRPTPPGSEGPFYPLPAMRYDDADNDLVKIEGRVAEAGGEIVRIGGRVLDSSGQPLVGARVEIWQCDVNGRYLHRGDRGGMERDAAFQGFGFDTTTAGGEYSFRTIRPVPYPGRAPHIHVKVLVGGRERLTTQFYVANDPGNDGDWLYGRIPSELREQVELKFTTAADIPEALLDIVV